MRLLTAIALLLIISSCAHNRIRFSKPHKHEVVEVTDDSDQQFIQEQYVFNTQEKQAIHHVGEPNELDEVEVAETDPVEDFASSTPPDTSGQMDAESKAIVINAALDAEDDARSARNLLIAALGTMWIPIVGFLLSFILFIMGWIKLNRANKSRYITQEGERFAWIATLLRNIYLVILILFLTLVMVIVALAFL